MNIYNNINLPSIFVKIYPTERVNKENCMGERSYHACRQHLLVLLAFYFLRKTKGIKMKKISAIIDLTIYTK